MLSKIKWYRKFVGGTWYQHQFTPDALWLSSGFTGTFWTKYGKINRYSRIIKTEEWRSGINLLKQLMKLDH